ncbi:MAG: pilus assembly protein PilP [Pseudomonadota bacterium]
MKLHRLNLAPLLACAALLAGCGDSDVKEVKQWMADVKRDTKVAVTPLSEPKTFIPFAYAEKDQIDPFSPNKLLAVLAQAAAKSDNPLKPDMGRARELLESYPLDTMRMVGTLQKGGVNYALLQIDRAVYQVKPGQRIGQNFGVIVSMGENVINIKEVVQDAAGEWVERMSKLELQESKETKK